MNLQNNNTPAHVTGITIHRKPRYVPRKDTDWVTAWADISYIKVESHMYVHRDTYIYRYTGYFTIVCYETERARSQQHRRRVLTTSRETGNVHLPRWGLVDRPYPPSLFYSSCRALTFIPP